MWPKNQIFFVALIFILAKVGNEYSACYHIINAPANDDDQFWLQSDSTINDIDEEPSEPVTAQCDYKNDQSLSNFAVPPSVYEDLGTTCFLLDLKDDLNISSFSKFEEKYTTLKIEISAKAVSVNTIGNHSISGRYIYHTSDFPNHSISLLLNLDDFLPGVYQVIVKIGLAFQLEENNRLYLNPKIFISLSSWWKPRSVDFGLTVGTVTFLPRNWAGHSPEITQG